MIRNRVMAAFAIAVAVMGLTVAVTMPVSHADVLPNGYDVSCKKANDSQVVCTIGGCPRVYEDYAGDVVHTRVNALPQSEIGKSCGATITQTVNMSSGFNYAVQGCRKHMTSGDDCGAWSDYTYTAPAVAAPPPAAPAPPPPAPAQTKQCPDGGPVIPVNDACPVKNEILKVAERHGVPVVLVANSGLRPSRDPMVAHVLVPQGADARIPNVTTGKVDITCQYVTVTASREGYVPQSVFVDTKVSGKGAAGFAGNIVAGGVIGMGVDVATGATLDHTPNPVVIRLQPESSASPVEPQPSQKPAKPAPQGKPVS